MSAHRYSGTTMALPLAALAWYLHTDEGWWNLPWQCLAWHVCTLVLRVDGSDAFPTEALVPSSSVIQTHYRDRWV